MGAEDHYVANLDVIQGIPDDKIKIITIPPEVATTEAQQLNVVATNDRDALIARKLDPALIDTLPARIGAFAFASAELEVNLQATSEYKVLWQKRSPELFSMRKKLLREFDFALEDDANAKKDLDAIKEGRTDADALADLLAFISLGKKYHAALEATGFDFSLLDKAKELHNEFGNIYADAIVNSNPVNEKRIIRDRAYTWLKEAVDAIRRHGKFVFADDPEHVQLYLSAHFQEVGSAGVQARMAKANQLNTTPTN